MSSQPSTNMLQLYIVIVITITHYNSTVLFSFMTIMSIYMHKLCIILHYMQYYGIIMLAISKIKAQTTQHCSM